MAVRPISREPPKARVEGLRADPSINLQAKPARRGKVMMKGLRGPKRQHP